MYHHKLEKDIRCPLDRGFAVFGGKWKPRILCVLGTANGPLRYSELLHALGNITDAVLSTCLRELVRDGVITRRQYEEIPPRVEYSLTAHGAQLLPILGSIAAWAGAEARSDCPADAPHCMHCNYREK